METSKETTKQMIEALRAIVQQARGDFNRPPSETLPLIQYIADTAIKAYETEERESSLRLVKVTLYQKYDGTSSTYMENECMGVFETNRRRETKVNRRETVRTLIQEGGCSCWEARRQTRQIEERLDGWLNDQWYYVGIYAEATIETTVNGLTLENEIRTPGLWGIESDSDTAYFKEVEDEELCQLRDMLREYGLQATTEELRALAGC